MPNSPFRLDRPSHSVFPVSFRTLWGKLSLPLKNFLDRSGLRKKITLFVAVILFIAISAVGYFSYSIAAEQVVNKVIDSQQGLVRQVGNSVDQVLSDISDISSLIVIDNYFQKDLAAAVPQKQYEAAPQKQNSVTSIPSLIPESSSFFDKIMAIKSYISMISVYGFNGLKYSVGTGYTGSTVVPFEEFKKNPLYKKSVNLNGSIGFEIFYNNPVLIYDNRLSRIVMYRTIKEFNSYTNIGILLIWLNEYKIRTIYQRNVPQQGSISIVDQNGIVVTSSQGDWVQKKLFKDPVNARELSSHQSLAKIIRVKGQKMLLTYTTLETLPWKVVMLTPTDILTEKVKNITLVILGVGLFCYILLLVFSSFITRIITTPLQKLLSSFKKVQTGDFSQQVDFPGGDEIGELGRGYNAMIARTRDLIERVYMLQIKEKEAELKALQAQINPHFLYNTLDTIFWKANKNQVPEISEMVYALSRIFRLSLNRGQDLTTVAQERELIQYYLALQKIRFKEKLETAMEIAPEIMQMPLPKLILQPFVENAIIHGIEGQSAGGKITISGRPEERYMVFEISDNGIGMEPETLERILTKTGTDPTFPAADPASSNSDLPSPAVVSGGYAIHNVIERLELYYSSNYYLEFNSRPGAGTCVILKIPYQINRENQHDKG